jgi:hypothetical protein
MRPEPTLEIMRRGATMMAPLAIIEVLALATSTSAAHATRQPAGITLRAAVVKQPS